MFATTHAHSWLNPNDMMINETINKLTERPQDIHDTRSVLWEVFTRLNVLIVKPVWPIVFEIRDFADTAVKRFFINCFNTANAIPRNSCWETMRPVNQTHSVIHARFVVWLIAFDFVWLCLILFDCVWLRPVNQRHREMHASMESVVVKHE